MSVLYWDFDGTLVKSNSLWSRSVFCALNEAAGDHNILFEDIRKYMSYGFTWHTPDQDYSALVEDKWWDFMNKYFYNSYLSLGIEQEIAKKAAQKVRQIIKQPDNYELYPDTISTLKLLKERGHKNILLSNNYPDLYEVMEKLSLADYFDDYVISAKVGFDKPRKEIFELAKSLNTRNEPMYMIGDNVSADIVGGNNAGMTTILVHNGTDYRADYSIQMLSEMIPIIK